MQFSAGSGVFILGKLNNDYVWALNSFVPARVLPFGMMASPLARKSKQQQQQLHNYSDGCRRVSPAFDEIRTWGF